MVERREGENGGELLMTEIASRPAVVLNKGQRVVLRSSLEARWAMFFSSMNLNWKYEPSRILMSNWRNYTPDFAVAKIGLIEVKPTIESIKHVESKLTRFMVENEQDRLWILVGFPPTTIALIADRKIWQSYDPVAYICQHWLCGNIETTTARERMDSIRRYPLDHSLSIQEVMRVTMLPL